MFKQPQPHTFSSIGRMVYRMKPDLAKTIINIIEDTKPLAKDLSKIKDFIKVFCHLKGIKQIPNDCKTQTLYLKHVFLLSIVKVYNPEILTGFHSSMKRKFRRELSKHLYWNANAISNIVPTLISRLEYYEEFQLDVTEVYLEFKNYINKNVTR